MPSPFSWDIPSEPSPDTASCPSPPTVWLSAKDMKLFGARPLSSASDIGIVKCKHCDKPLLRSFVAEHQENCDKIRSAAKKSSPSKSSSKKRKASPETQDDPSAPAKKKAKPPPKTKGRSNGPVDLDRHCGVINDKGLPCTRRLTCKSHSMGAKRAVQGRSRDYDVLLIEWQRANNPNWVEPPKKETKAEKKEKKEREKLEKKRLAMEAAAAAGLDPNAKKPGAGAGPGKKGGKKGAAAAAAAAAVRADSHVGDDTLENLDDVDSEAEVDQLVKAFRTARDKTLIGVPLALPYDAGSWFVQRREKARCCRDLLLNALGSTGNTAGPGVAIGISALGMARANSIGSRLV